MTGSGTPPHTCAPPGRRHGQTAPRGQFFTLEVVADFMWRVVGLVAPAPPPWRVADLAAGTGVLLESGWRGGWTRPGLAFGLEIDTGVIAAGRARSVLGPPLWTGDGLFDWPTHIRRPLDVAIGNPPFGRSRSLLSEAQRSRLASEARDLLPVWGGRVRTKTGGLGATAGNCRVELLFLARALQRVRRDRGVVAFLVPDGVLSNVREQVARDWIGRRARLLVAVALPGSAFRRRGLNARAHLVILCRQASSRSGNPPALLVARRHAGRGCLPVVLDGIYDDLVRLQGGATPAGTAGVDPAQLAGQRWDPAFWVGRRALDAWCGQGDRHAPLGDFIELLIYGPIVRGGPPAALADGVLSIRQGDFGDTGLHLGAALRVAPGSAHDPPGSRVRAGDLLLPRSGAGALGRNRVAVYPDHGPAANIGCFVDLIRLREGLNPYYLWIFLRSRPGWGQIRSLMNGVGTPNLSFTAIRSLRVPVLVAAEQAAYEADYRRLVLPLHGADPARRPGAARQAFAALVRRLEDRLLVGLPTGRGP